MPFCQIAHACICPGLQLQVIQINVFLFYSSFIIVSVQDNVISATNQWDDVLLAWPWSLWTVFWPRTEYWTQSLNRRWILPVSELNSFLAENFQTDGDTASRGGGC